MVNGEEHYCHDQNPRGLSPVPIIIIEVVDPHRVALCRYALV